MTSTDYDYRALLNRYVDILKYDTVNLFSSTKLQSITVGVPSPNPINAQRYAFVTMDKVNDTFYATGSAVSAYEFFTSIIVRISADTAQLAEYNANAYIQAIKANIKNNTRLYVPGTATGAMVDRAWPIRSVKGTIPGQPPVVQAAVVTVRATLTQ